MVFSAALSGRCGSGVVAYGVVIVVAVGHLIKGRLEQGVKVRQGFRVCKRCWEFHKDKENKTKQNPNRETIKERMKETKSEALDLKEQEHKLNHTNS